MRYIKDLLLEKAILHVVDVNADEAIIASKLLPINEEVEDFVRKHVLKSLNSDETFAARFLDSTLIPHTAVKDVLNNNPVFEIFSRRMTERMFKIIKRTDIPSGDLLFVQFVAAEQRCFGILKLDYQLSHVHNVSFVEDDLNINLITQEVGLPGTGKQLSNCAFFTKGVDDTIEMIVLDKKLKVDENNVDYFVKSFLEAVLISDDTNKTRKFKSTVEKWTQRNLSDNIDIASNIRNVVEETLLNGGVVNMNEFKNIEGISEPIQESLNESFNEAGYVMDFQIDKSFIEKKMKKKTIKTDTGFALTGEYDLFKDNHKYKTKVNGDGTIDMIIKNIRNITEK